MQSVSPAKRWTRKHSFALRICSVFFFVVLSILCDAGFEKDSEGISVVWLANGLVLSYLLLAPRWRMLPYLFTGFVAMLVGGYLIRESWSQNLIYDCLNIVEVTVAALLLKRKSTEPPAFTDGAYLLRFISFGCVLAPAIAGIALGTYGRLAHHQDFIHITLGWFLGDSLGIAVITPTCVAILHSRLRNLHLIRRGWIYPILVLAITLIICSQTRAPVIFLILPFLILVLTQLDLGWAAMCTLMVAMIGGWFTVHNLGPLSVASPVHGQLRAAILQLFLATSLFMLYTVSLVFGNLGKVEKELKKIVALHKLVVDNSRDIIILGSMDGIQDYVSPAVEPLTGWQPAELRGRKFQEVIHPHDLLEVEMALRAMQAGSEGGTLEFRSRKKDGTYLWVEANLRVVVSDRKRVA